MLGVGGGWHPGLQGLTHREFILLHGADQDQTQSFALVLNGRFLSRAIVGI